jgi:hypothetical protein
MAAPEVERREDEEELELEDEDEEDEEDEEPDDELDPGPYAMHTVGRELTKGLMTLTVRESVLESKQLITDGARILAWQSALQRTPNS